MRTRGMEYWLPTYVAEAPARWMRRVEGRPLHVMVLVCDHFEPRHGATREGQDVERMRTWSREYPAFRRRCQAAFGHAPRHTWFYPPHHGLGHLGALADLAFEGHGEVELHYHHEGDTSASLRKALGEVLAGYHRLGLLLESGDPPRPAFGFVHGDWALDNAGGRYCGVNDELTILRELGCWGDFTMPSTNDCQTRKINSIYYAVDDPARPKSHDWGEDARVGRPAPPGLFLMQGPLVIDWRAPGRPQIENGSLTTRNASPHRLQAWLRSHVHVRGRPEWVFVKLHTHGAVEKDHDALFGERAFAYHQAMNAAWNDGVHRRLHYVTAREAYNIARAAESGRDGDPEQYRDFEIRPYAPAFYRLDAPHRLKACTEAELRIEDIQAGTGRLRLARGPWREVSGALRAASVSATGRLRVETGGDGGQLSLVVEGPLLPRAVRGARVIGEESRDGARRFQVAATGTAELELSEAAARP